jgi:hypothetical protein
MTRCLLAILLVALAALACEDNNRGAVAPLADLSDGGADPTGGNDRLPPPPMGGW